MSMPSGDVWMPILLAVVGGVLVIGLSILAGDDSEDEVEDEDEVQTTSVG